MFMPQRHAISMQFVLMCRTHASLQGSLFDQIIYSHAYAANAGGTIQYWVGFAVTNVVSKFEGGVKEVVVRLSAAGGDRGVGVKCVILSSIMDYAQTCSSSGLPELLLAALSFITA